MIPIDNVGAANGLDGDRRFVAGTLSWPEELAALLGLLKNYAESSRALHLRHGFAFRARLPGPTRHRQPERAGPASLPAPAPIRARAHQHRHAT